MERDRITEYVMYTYIFLLLVKVPSPSGLHLLFIHGNGNTYQSCVFYLPNQTVLCFPSLCADGKATQPPGSSFMDFAATDAFQIVWMAIQTNSIGQNRMRVRAAFKMELVWKIHWQLCNEKASCLQYIETMRSFLSLLRSKELKACAPLLQLNRRWQ